MANPQSVPLPEGDSPASDWLPIYKIRTPYDEDEIVGILNEFAQLYIGLSMVPFDEVLWPPEGGHGINEELCREMGAGPAAISLMRRLPYATGVFAIHLYSWTYMVNYLDDDAIRAYRESPTEIEGELNLILPHEVCIASGDRDADQLFLDIKENTIRAVVSTESFEDLNPPDAPLERPGEDHYRNYWPRHAPSFLRFHLNKLKALDRIPAGTWEYNGYFFTSEHEWVRRKIKYILTGTYGWPDAFQQDKWDRDREEVWERTLEEWEHLGKPKSPPLKF